jgi:pyruvate,water dikinase
MSGWRLQALFHNFKAILELNNTALASMAEMEQALGGEYIFDRPYLEDSVRRISSLVHHAVYCLNALTGNAYVPLYDRYQDILAVLDAILAGGSTGRAGAPVFALEDIGWELEPLAGSEAVCLAELGRHPGVRAARGAVLTTAGVDVLLGRAGTPAEAGPVREAVETSLAAALQGMEAERGGLLVAGVRAGGDFAEDVPDLAGDFFAFEPDLGPHDSPAARLAGAREIALRVEREARACPGPLAVLLLSVPTADVSGTVRTRAQDETEMLRVEARQAGAGDDAFYLRRVHPFDMVRSQIAPRQGGRRFADGRRATDAVSRSMGRGSALIPPPALKSLAETAMTLERMLGVPVEAQWREADGEACVLCRVRPRPVSLEAPSGRELAEEVARATVLARGGQPYSQVAAGRAGHVREDTAPADFPPGAVAVARTASPRLTPVLRMASAVVTEYGTAAGHLATVARELRLPAVFGLADATRLIPDGRSVTVDAGEGVVYEGVLESLLRHGAAGELSPTDPEYRTLRRLLRFIMPLHLVNPDSPGFTVQGCRTMHDILHFCHDRAVDELAHFQERRPGLGAIRSRRLHSGVQLDMRVLDIGGGVDPSAGDEAAVGDVRSAPFSLFLRGLPRPAAWSDGPSTLALGDIMANMPRTMGMLEGGARPKVASLAVVGGRLSQSEPAHGLPFQRGRRLSGPGAEPQTTSTSALPAGWPRGTRRERRGPFHRPGPRTYGLLVTREADPCGRPPQSWPRTLTCAPPWRLSGPLTAYCRQNGNGHGDEGDVERIFDDFSARFMPSRLGRACRGGGRRREPVAPVRRPLACPPGAREERALNEVKARYHAFRVFLENNGRALELVIDLDRALARGEDEDLPPLAEALLAVTLELVDGLNLLSADAYEELFALHGRMSGDVRESMTALERLPHQAEPCLPLGGVEPSAHRLVGSKAANLATLRRMGLPVPDGFVCTVRACRRFLEQGGIDAGIRRAMGDVEAGRSGLAEAAAANPGHDPGRPPCRPTGRGPVGLPSRDGRRRCGRCGPSRCAAAACRGYGGPFHCRTVHVGPQRRRGRGALRRLPRGRGQRLRGPGHGLPAAHRHGPGGVRPGRARAGDGPRPCGRGAHDPRSWTSRQRAHAR